MLNGIAKRNDFILDGSGIGDLRILLEIIEGYEDYDEGDY